MRERFGRSSFNLSFQHDDLDSKIVAAFDRISHAFRGLLWNAAKAHGLSPLQVQVLVFLLGHTERQRRVSSLAREMGVTKPTVSDAVASLESKRLIERTASSEDGRTATLSLTRSGRSLATELSGWADTGRDVLRKLPLEERRMVEPFLMSWIAALQEAGVVTVARMCTTCRYFESRHGRAHCGLLDRPLPPEALRVDCPEHLPPLVHEPMRMMGPVG